jgi:hypothetical protein
MKTKEMTAEQYNQLTTAIGPYKSDPCGVEFYYDSGESLPWRIATDQANESFATFDELLETTKSWKKAFDNA